MNIKISLLFHKIVSAVFSVLLDCSMQGGGKFLYRAE